MVSGSIAQGTKTPSLPTEQVAASRPPVLELWEEADDDLAAIRSLDPAVSASSAIHFPTTWLKVLAGNLSSGLLHLTVLLMMTTWVVHEAVPRRSDTLTLATETEGESESLQLMAASIPHDQAITLSPPSPQVFTAETSLEMTTPQLQTELLAASSTTYNTSFSAQSSAGGNAGAGPEVDFFGSKAVGRTFVFVLDASGSMNDGQRFARAAEELMNTLQGLDETHKFCVLAFNDQTWAMLNVPLDRVSLLPATEENKKSLRVWLTTLRPIGWTDPRSSLEVALKLSPSAIFLLSDGEFKQGPPERKLGYHTLSGVHRANRDHIPIHTLAFEDPANAAILRGMAKASGGSYRYVPPQSSGQD